MKNDPWLNIVLYQPEIPQNTGNIARLCAATNTRLHIVEPCGFVLYNKTLKRAGLEYWDTVDKVIHEDWEQLIAFFSAGKKPLPIKPVSTMGFNLIHEAQFNKGDILIFGSETKGLPESILNTWAEQSVSIPLWGQARSLNLANSVSIAIYEVARRFSYDL